MPAISNQKARRAKLSNFKQGARQHVAAKCLKVRTRGGLDRVQLDTQGWETNKRWPLLSRVTVWPSLTEELPRNGRSALEAGGWLRNGGFSRAQDNRRRLAFARAAVCLASRAKLADAASALARERDREEIEGSETIIGNPE